MNQTKIEDVVTLKDINDPWPEWKKRNKARDKKLADIFAAIEAWKSDCDNRGEEPVVAASFAYTDENGASRGDKNGNLIRIGLQEEIDELLAQTVATSNEMRHRLHSKVRFAYET